MAPPSDFPVPHVILPTQPHHYTIIALHGRGSNGAEFAEELFEDKSSRGLTLSEHFPHTKWIFPSSQKRHSTVFREKMDEWFDTYSLTDPSTQQELQVEGLRDSIKHILDIISKEAEFIPACNIVLLGISQGCATAIHALLAGQHQLGGFIGIAGWLPFRKQIDNQAALSKFYKETLGLPITGTGMSQIQTSATTPALLCHCTDDDVVDVELGHQLRDTLTASDLNINVTFTEFASGGHWISAPHGFDAIVDFLRNRGFD
ncbi:MAG: hypothetical protein LQ337_007995 [Flavoplaca oasis]|nr:MAG: hypothetical protein LQ337_007995 [Flavoplaca oasis]